MENKQKYKYFGSIVGSLQNLHTLAGQVIGTRRTVPILSTKSIENKSLKISSAFAKSVTELIDNVIDIHTISGWKYNQLIFNWLKDGDGRVIGYEVADNGIGIQINAECKIENEPAVRILTELNAGSNSKERKVSIDWKNMTIETLKTSSKGRNGIGAVLSALTAKQSLIVVGDGKHKLQILTSMDASNILKKVHNGFDGTKIEKIPTKLKREKSTFRGVKFKVFPDMKLFGLNFIDKDHIEFIESYIKMQMLSYPKLKIFLNGQVVRITEKQIKQMLAENVVNFDYETTTVLFHDNIELGTMMTSNGLVNDTNRKTNMFIDVLETGFMNALRNYISEHESGEVAQYCKPLLIKEQFPFFLIIKTISIIEYVNQEKTIIGNSKEDVRKFYKFIGLEFDKLVLDIIHTDMYKNWMKEIRKTFEKKRELKKIKKSKQFLKDLKDDLINDFEKITISERKERLWLFEGLSAYNAVISKFDSRVDSGLALTGKIDNIIKIPNGILGLKTREDGSYVNHNIGKLFSLLGVDIDKIGHQRKFDFNDIIIASDADDDGAHIAVLIIVMICTIAPEYKSNGKLRVFNTPSFVQIKNGKILGTYYETDEPTGNNWEFIKGLGRIPKELWKYLLTKYKSIYDMTKPIILTDIDFKWLENALDSESNLRKEIIGKKYRLITK